MLNNTSKKVHSVYIEGKLQTRKWQDKDGNDRWTTEIVGNQFNFLDSRRSDNSVGDFSSNDDQNNTASISTDMDDDIPF